jgi:hypothetical protein
MVGGSNKMIETNSEISRVRAALVNTGKLSFVEAENKLTASNMSIGIDEAAAGTPAGQAAFLTAVATGARSFGRVLIGGHLDRTLVVALPEAGETLRDAAVFFGASEEPSDSSVPHVIIGSSSTRTSGFQVQAFWNGWIAGTAPGARMVDVGRSDCPLAGIAAGALAVAQVFLREQGDVRAGHTIQRCSLWSPEQNIENTDQVGPIFSEIYLPTQLWLIGLGNLGQAYLWSLTHLPYPTQVSVRLFLQDDQFVERENWGTSILVQRGRYGLLKTRLAEDWATRRGFEIRRIDRRVDEHFFRLPQEPGIALAGLDTMGGRRLLGLRGFEFVIDAGLGETVEDYRKFRINVFNSEENPAAHFIDVEDRTAKTVQDLMQLPSYIELAQSMNDGGCGAAMLAGSSVAVPFVSAVAGAIAITESIRVVSGYPHHVAITGNTDDLRSMRASLGVVPQRTVVPGVLPGNSVERD